MASRAYQPDQTQAPYRSWLPSGADTRLQSDDLLISFDVVGFMGRQMLVFDPHGEPADLGILPTRTDFKTNYQQWLQDSRFDSLPDRMRRHGSYKTIVAMGDRVVPLIAAELRRKPSFLFLALEEITEKTPVPDEALGNLGKTVAAWLSWLRK